MATIHLLSSDLANQIAAGEVVERPASAVKELVENALDAGATRVEVEIEGGGISKICVSDDGQGMSSDDAVLCLQRHATSKIESLPDLERVESYGFRGEALPSIASVSRFQLITRAREEDAGTRVFMEGGGEPASSPTGRPVGTTVEVRDLFFNVPARRKFLRSSGTESGHVTEVFECAALANPEVTFILTRDGRKLREYLRAPSRQERAAQVFGDEPMAQCSGERGPLRLEAFLSRPERARSGASGLKLMVNSRPVRDRALALTVAQAYGSVLERGRYPRGVVYVELAPQLVDVNVHPQKAEVRFADPRAAMDAVYSMLTKSLSTSFSIPTAPRSRWGGTGRAARPQMAPTADADPPPLTAAPEPSDPWGLTPQSTDTHQAHAPPHIVVRDSAASPIRPAPELQWSNLRFVAQVRQTYLICEADDGLYVLDQHAAAERVAFDRLRKAYRDRSVASQSLLFPLSMEVSGAEADFVAEHADAMVGVGLDLRRRGPETVSIHAVPKLLQRASPERLVRDLLSEMMRTGGRGFSDAVDLTLATMACHGSIRAGDVVSAEEANALLHSLDEADFAGHCPHGRPVVTALSWAELIARSADARAMADDERALWVLVGPTASGKTELAVRMATRVGGEIISADSVQVYRHFDLGSGKPSAEERKQATHHLIDIADPHDRMDAASWSASADEAIAAVRARGNVPIVCGGTFLWVKTLLRGLAPAPTADESVRAAHRDLAERLGREALHAALAKVDPVSAERLNPNDFVRVSRALEVYELSGKPMSQWHAEHGFKEARYPARLVGVQRPPGELDERIVRRAEAMFQAGWVDEVRSLVALGFAETKPMAAVGYKQVLAAQEAAAAPSDTELLGAVVRATRVFARRQRTWLRDEDVCWLAPGSLPAGL